MQSNAFQYSTLLIQVAYTFTGFLASYVYNILYHIETHCENHPPLVLTLGYVKELQTGSAVRWVNVFQYDAGYASGLVELTNALYFFPETPLGTF